MARSRTPKNKKNDHQINRRDFVKQAGAAALGGVFSMSVAERLLAAADPNCALHDPKKPTYEVRNQVEGMTYTPLGRTNLMVSRLSLGGGPWTPAVVRSGINQGVNLVHGSLGYKTMEAQSETLAKLWDKIWYVLKFTEEDMADTTDKCLKILNRDHIDIIVPVIRKVNGTDYDKMKANFEKIKKAGKVRFLGATVHVKNPAEIPAVCRDAIDSDIFDMILTMYQPANKEAIDKALAVAIEKNIGTMSMKTVQGAKDEKRGEAVAAALADGKINTVLKGISNLPDLNMYLRVARFAETAKPASDQQACLDPTVCGACGACLDCPQNLEIPEIMRCATYYHPQGDQEQYAAQTYREIPREATILECIDCGTCEERCPRSLPIRATLRWAHNRWA